MRTLFIIFTLFSVGCSTINPSFPLTSGNYLIYNERAKELLDLTAEIEVLDTGFKWVEGPVWSTSEGCLLFSDIPNNRVHKYCDGKGTSVYLDNSGGSNGLAFDQNNRLILMQSGTRQVAEMNAALDAPATDYKIRADKYDTKRLNSPNDLVVHSSGTIYFTDPPYGLPKKLKDPAKELPFQGIYRLSIDNQLTLLDASITYPNGIAFTTDESKLITAASNYDKPAWYIFDVNDKGLISNKQLLLDSRNHTIEEYNDGMPDGMKLHSSGIIFATGPGGVWLIQEDGALLARILIPGKVANIAFNQDESSIFLTAHTKLLKLNLKK